MVAQNREPPRPTVSQEGERVVALLEQSNGFLRLLAGRKQGAIMNKRNIVGVHVNRIENGELLLYIRIQ